MSEREELTSFLINHDFDDAFWHSKFWDISEAEAEELLDKSRDCSVSEEVRENLERIEKRLEAVPLEAVKKYRHGHRPLEHEGILEKVIGDALEALGIDRSYSTIVFIFLIPITLFVIIYILIAIAGA